ncbi:hypothetical protein [Pelagibacterium lentulum]|uniref:Uncharacterized protein n=1 Tax=Pelagibacterium lentulum TaxID=2029865 RepID=A0A916W3M8_9HYPH|nr:hypothetical protein [Pelagibacterium lentulum]GGA64711.1 hypothetical protein GCM10011499_38970 [Pelagibacterium lentulum]
MTAHRTAEQAQEVTPIRPGMEMLRTKETREAIAARINAVDANALAIKDEIKRLELRLSELDHALEQNAIERSQLIEMDEGQADYERRLERIAKGIA